MVYQTEDVSGVWGIIPYHSQSIIAGLLSDNKLPIRKVLSTIEAASLFGKETGAYV